MTVGKIDPHDMMEQQATVFLRGHLDDLTPSIALRVGQSRVTAQGNALVQEAKSLSVPGELGEHAEALLAEIRRRLEPVTKLQAEARIWGLVNRRRVRGKATYERSYTGFWGRLQVDQKPLSVFGSSANGPVVFRRGPWERWGLGFPEFIANPEDDTFVFSPYCATLIHEAIGHAMEAEYLIHSPFRQNYGERISCEQLFVMDRPDLPDLPGTMTHDDVGNPATATTLVHRGHVVGDLDRDKGVMRRGSYRDFPKIRATNLVIKGGRSDPHSWLNTLPEALFVCWIESGKWQPGTQTLDLLTGPVYQLHNGNPVGYVPWLHLRFETLELLNRIAEIGADLTWDPQVHWCLKQLQSVPISMTGPSILVEGRRGV